MTVNSTVNAASFKQTAGTATTALAGNITTSNSIGLDISANSILLDGLTVNTQNGNGVVNFNAPTILGGDVTITRGTGSVSFASTLKSQSSESNDLTINGVNGGNVTFGGSVGDWQPSSTVNLGDVLIDTAQNVSAGIPYFYARSLVQASGSETTTLGKQIGMSGPQGINITAANIQLGTTTNNATTYDTSSGNGTIRFNAPTTILTSAEGLGVFSGNGNIAFESTVNKSSVAGAYGKLYLTGNGTTSLNGAVGNINALDQLKSDGGGTTVMHGGIVNATSQVYTDAVILGVDNTITGTTTFNGPVDAASAGGQSLTVVGVTTFGNAVGNSFSLGNLTATAGYTTNLNGGSVQTTNDQTYNAAVSLGANTTLTSSSGGNVAFGSSVTGSTRNLTVNTAGNTSFATNLSLASLTTDAGGATLINGSSVTTSGSQAYGDAVIVGASTTLTASSITTGNTVSAGANNLTMTTDAIDLGGNVSGSGNLVIQPKTATTTIGLGDGAGNLSLSATELAYLQPGFNLVTIGSTSGTGVITVGASGASFKDDVLIRGDATSGNIVVTGDLSTGLSTGPESGNITLTAGALNINGNITTSGKQIQLNAGSDLTITSSLSTQAVVNTGVASGAIDINVSGSGSDFVMTSGSLNTSGTDNNNGDAGAAGALTIDTTAGNITLAGVNTSGGNATGGNGNGGNAAAIGLTAGGSGVTTLAGGSLLAKGGAGNGTGGSGNGADISLLNSVSNCPGVSV